MFQSIKGALQRFQNRKDVLCELEGRAWGKEWRDVIEKVNVSAASKTQAVSLSKDGVLLVKVANPFLLAELRFQEEEIKHRVQARSKNVKKIRFIS
ncbi:MAG: DUF721 domain-containing protein [Candidatus Spechtbacteria bacterium]|nr:DUF721 domain-containing protein [Candidatus Spechtbacteria bacterium]